MSGTYLLVVLRRSLGFWIGLRLLLAVVIILIALQSGAPAAISMTAMATPGTSVIMVLLTAGLLLFDAHAVGEDLLLANFGVSRFQVGLRAAMIPAIAEFLVVSTFALMAGT